MHKFFLIFALSFVFCAANSETSYAQSWSCSGPLNNDECELEEEKDEEEEEDDDDDDRWWEEDHDREDPEDLGEDHEEEEERPSTCEREQDAEEMRDRLAQQIAKQIKDTKSDWKRREYGAVIYYSDANGYRRDELDRGNSDEVDFTVSPRGGETVVGIVHNHPRGGGDAPSDEDWEDVAEFLFEQGISDESNFAHYILSGDDGKLYEYDADNDQTRNGGQSERDDANGECDE